MSYFEFPHTRNYDGDLGYIIKKLKLDIFYNQIQQAQTIAEIKNYINEIVKVLSMRDLNNKEATKN